MSSKEYIKKFHCLKMYVERTWQEWQNE